MSEFEQNSLGVLKEKRRSTFWTIVLRIACKIVHKLMPQNVKKEYLLVISWISCFEVHPDRALAWTWSKHGNINDGLQIIEHSCLLQRSIDWTKYQIGTLDVVFSRFRVFLFTITLRQRPKGVTPQSAWKGSLSVELKGIVIISILNLNIKFLIYFLHEVAGFLKSQFQCPKFSYNNVMLPEDSNAVVWKTVRLWLMVVGRQKSWYTAWKGIMLWLMAACLPPARPICYFN